MWLTNARKMTKRFALTLGLTFALTLTLTACQNDAETPAETELAPDVVATYNNGTTGQIKQSELDTYISIISFYDPTYKEMQAEPNFKENVIKQYVGLDVYYNKIKADAPKDVEDKVQEQLKQMKEFFTQQANGAADGWAKTLEQNKFSEADLVTYLRKTATVAFYMDGQVKDEDVKTYFDEPLKTDKNAYQYVTVRHILVSTKTQDGASLRSDAEALKLAKEVQTKLVNGSDFAKLAKEYSDDPGSKDLGGLYEKQNPNNWVEEFKKASLELPLNKISDPVKTEYGYHVMKVEERDTFKYEDVKGAVRQELVTKKMTELMQTEIKNSGLLIKGLKTAPDASPMP
jgi:foldase protein PrsA